MKLDDRMKAYESVFDHRLTRRIPVIARFDIRAGHTLTKGMGKPFDLNFIQCMADTALALCKEIQGAQLAYVQSDEISVLITDFETHQTEPWFDYRINKMASIGASIASVAFYRAFWDHFADFKLLEHVEFDARFFNLPREEVNNYFYYRQADATRNSIQSYGQVNFSAKELHQVSCNMIKTKLEHKGVIWDKEPTFLQRGLCVRRDGSIDRDIPLFQEDHSYIEQYLLTEEEKCALK